MTFSVRFYKRLILVFLALLIIVPTVFAVCFGVKSASLERQLSGEETKKPSSSKASPAPSQPVSSDTPAAVPTGYDTTLAAEPLDYQLLYPSLYGKANVTPNRVRAIDTVYLTFDCMPSSDTMKILDILDTYEVKATFFVMGTNDEETESVLKEIVSRGHTIGLRCYSQSYQEIYRSVADYLEDFKKIYDLVRDATGVKAEIFRFPRGSVNSYNGPIYQELIAEMLRRNFIFFDWSISGGDGKTSEEIAENVINSMADKDRGIVLFQDMAGNENMVGALPAVIEGLQTRGYSLQALTANVLPVVFSYKSTS